MEARDDFLGETRFDFARMLVPPLVDRRCGLKRKQLDIAPHQFVGDRHQLPENLVRRLGYADVVAERLRHLLLAVQAFEKRHRQDALRLLAVLLLQLATDQEVELLVSAAELDVGFHRDRVIALHQRIEKLMQRDRLLAGEALGKIVALEKLRDGVLGSEADDALGPQLVRPLRVVENLSLRGVKDLENLLLISFCIPLDLFARERRTCLVLARGVADHPGEIADQELHLMAQLLKIAQLVDYDGMAEVQVGRGRIEAELHAKLAPAGELFRQLLFYDQLDRPPTDSLNGLLDRTHIDLPVGSSLLNWRRLLKEQGILADSWVRSADWWV